jgi:hypothetical protein
MNTARAALAVIPTVNVVVAAATLMGTCITSLLIGVLRKPPLVPVLPATNPVKAIKTSPKGNRFTRYGTTWPLRVG